MWVVNDRGPVAERAMGWFDPFPIPLLFFAGFVGLRVTEGRMSEGAGVRIGVWKARK